MYSNVVSKIRQSYDNVVLILTHLYCSYEHTSGGLRQRRASRGGIRCLLGVEQVVLGGDERGVWSALSRDVDTDSVRASKWYHVGLLYVTHYVTAVKILYCMCV